MASEAKIGLLLGLAIIFVVAFVINGLPRFGNDDQSDRLAMVMDGNPPGIGPAVPAGIFGPGQTPEAVGDENAAGPEDNQGSRDRLAAAISPEEVGRQLGPESPEQTDDPGAPAEVKQPEPVRPAWPKVHVVRKGENLGDIAKMYYGPTEGNRKANVMKIFESNRSLLESPDMIFPGQKLIIPSLWASGTNRKTIEQIFPDSMFERVESIGRRHL
ncbi:MAG: LysM peptidoglycan-binding domain-containing protein [Planctomycetota bacterium]|jgi:nucleoid-associated protein YgaU